MLEIILYPLSLLFLRSEWIYSYFINLFSIVKMAQSQDMCSLLAKLSLLDHAITVLEPLANLWDVVL